jgi:hypothetical protein
MIFAAADIGGLLPVAVLALLILFRTLATMRRKGGDGSRLAPAGDQPPSRPRATPAAESAEDAERTRRVREEVQRRIAGRLRAPPAFAPSPPPVAPAPPDSGDLLREFAGVETEAEPVAPAPAEDRAEIERQRRLEREFQAANAARAEQARKTNGRLGEPSPPSPPARAGGYGWISDLRGREGARHAIVLREIIGPPLALRR